MIIRHKQSLVHKIPSGVAILSHVYGVTMNRPPSGICKSIWQTWGDKEFLSFISAKFEWESPPSILVTRNPNWSQRLGMETGCVKGMY
jgi:hypothetical protein